MSTTTSTATHSFKLDVGKFKPMTAKEFQAIRTVLSAGDYSKNVSPEMALLAEQRSGRAFPTTALSKIRGELLVLRAMEASRVFPQVSAQAVRRYESGGEDINEIALSLNQPAMAIFRAVLKHRGLSTLQVKLGTQGSNKILTTARDLEQQKIAALHDHATTAHVDNSVESSLVFEAEIQAFLDAHGIAYKTQAQLIKPGELTPDFLLPQPIDIAGHQVSWIDAKDFFGGVTTFMTKKTRTQASRYIEAFGSGAIMYSRGLTEAHRAGELPPKCLAMDFRWLVPMTTTSSGPTAIPLPLKKARETVSTPAPAPAAPASPPWQHVLDMIGSGSYTSKLDAARAGEINALLPKDAQPFTLDELNQIRRDLLLHRATELDRTSVQRLRERWKGGEDLFAVCAELNCAPHLALRHLVATCKQDEARLAAAKEHTEWLLAVPVEARNHAFVARMGSVLRQAGLEFDVHLNLSALVLDANSPVLMIEDRTVRWIYCYDGLGGALGGASAKPLRRDVDALRKRFGGHGAICFSLGMLPGFSIFSTGNAAATTTELMVDFRDLALDYT